MKKTNSEEAVYLKLKQAIRKRYIKQGSQLVEITLARQLGVSRTPVRSAIRRLEADGLVNSIPNRGAFIITPTPREIKETFLVRAELEMMAVRLAAKALNSSQLAELHQLIATEASVVTAGDFDAYYQVNDTLHLKIAEFSGNRVLVSSISELLDRTRIYLILYDPFDKLDYTPTSEHQAIIKYLSIGDVKQACQAMSDHLGSAVSGLDLVGQLPDDYLSL